MKSGTKSIEHLYLEKKVTELELRIKVLEALVDGIMHLPDNSNHRADSIVHYHYEQCVNSEEYKAIQEEINDLTELIRKGNKDVN